ncbi:MAG: hypothetical protein PHP57_12375 [Sideroxydans sp.]|nr:hypothetical protein [Sideroxydans sp.]
MIQYLRKGRSSVYLQFKNDGFSIGAENFQAETSNQITTLSFTLHPVDGNQRDDEKYLHSGELLSIQIHDDFVIENLTEYLKNHSTNVSALHLEILSKNKKFTYSVEFGAAGLNFLPLIVERIIG